MKLTVDNGNYQIHDRDRSAAMAGLIALQSNLGSLAKVVEAMKVKWISPANFEIVVSFNDLSGVKGKFESIIFSTNGLNTLHKESFITKTIVSIGVDGETLVGKITQHLETCQGKHARIASDTNELLTARMVAVV